MSYFSHFNFCRKPLMKFHDDYSKVLPTCWICMSHSCHSRPSCARVLSLYTAQVDTRGSGKGCLGRARLSSALFTNTLITSPRGNSRIVLIYRWPGVETSVCSLQGRERLQRLRLHSVDQEGELRRSSIKTNYFRIVMRLDSLLRGATSKQCA